MRHPAAGRRVRLGTSNAQGRARSSVFPSCQHPRPARPCSHPSHLAPQPPCPARTFRARDAPSPPTPGASPVLTEQTTPSRCSSCFPQYYFITGGVLIRQQAKRRGRANRACAIRCWLKWEEARSWHGCKKPLRGLQTPRLGARTGLVVVLDTVYKSLGLWDQPEVLTCCAGRTSRSGGPGSPGTARSSRTAHSSPPAPASPAGQGRE